MITELALERTEFTCGHRRRQWSTGYDIRHYHHDDGREWEYSSRDGTPADPPYTPEGAPPRPERGRPPAVARAGSRPTGGARGDG
ncbi:hypothetical protein ACGF13_25675 [Kitasatospora sp. NPDC048286]|uniref:hypothetical protein n=1 Tax=Kitasatospora sp. NPDC048286 TaxID=3364047 RepID=UPI00371B500E